LERQPWHRGKEQRSLNPPSACGHSVSVSAKCTSFFHSRAQGRHRRRPPQHSTCRSGCGKLERPCLGAHLVIAEPNREGGGRHFAQVSSWLGGQQLDLSKPSTEGSPLWGPKTPATPVSALVSDFIPLGRRGGAWAPEGRHLTYRNPTSRETHRQSGPFMTGAAKPPLNLSVDPYD
jgi:hypothetical protein